MSVLNKQIVLVLNNLWMPIGKTTVKQGLKIMFSQMDGITAGKALDIKLNKKQDGSWDYENPEYYNPVDWAEWCELEVRDCDPVIHLSHNRVIRAPIVVIAQNCSKITVRELKPTKANVFAKYNNTCIWSGKKLPRNRLNLEHLYPVSRGGKNTWDNLAPADIKLNSMKGDKLPHEVGLTPKYKLSTPKAVPFASLITEPASPFWLPFIMKINT